MSATISGKPRLPSAARSKCADAAFPPDTISAMNRRDFLRTSGAAGGLAASGCGGAKGQAQHPVDFCRRLFTRPRLLLGNKLVKTPRTSTVLAQEGVRYTNCICTAPVCSAARSALMVGMFQTSVGGHNHPASHPRRRLQTARGSAYPYALLPPGRLPYVELQNPRAGAHGRRQDRFQLRFRLPGVRRRGFGASAPRGSLSTHRSIFRKRTAPSSGSPNLPSTPGDIELAPYYPDHPGRGATISRSISTTAQHLDVKVGKVIQRLKDEGVYEDTIVFFFGDHGQALHRGKQWLYEQGILIPLIVRIPEKIPPRRLFAGARSTSG